MGFLFAFPVLIQREGTSRQGLVRLNMEQSFQVRPAKPANPTRRGLLACSLPYAGLLTDHMVWQEAIDTHGSFILYLLVLKASSHQVLRYSLVLTSEFSPDFCQKMIPEGCIGIILSGGNVDFSRLLKNSFS
jgi:hypothetical protein